MTTTNRQPIAGTPFHYEEGWTGAMTRRQAKGAVPNGTTIEKTNTAPGDTHQDGATGKVIGSLYSDELKQVDGSGYLYFIEWDDVPKTSVGVSGLRIKTPGNN